MKISSQDINGANVNWKTMPAFVCVFVHMAVRCLVCKRNILNTYDSVLPSVFIHFHWNSYFTNCFSHSFFLADVLCMHVCAYKFYIPLSNCSNRMKYSKFDSTVHGIIVNGECIPANGLRIVCLDKFGSYHAF